MAPRNLPLLQGTLDVLVLRSLERGPMHGYAVARFLRDSSGGVFSILDGALYTSLRRLEARHWVTSEWGISDQGKRARFYSLTAKGRRELRAQAATWDQYVTAIGNVMRSRPEPS